MSEITDSELRSTLIRQLDYADGRVLPCEVGFLTHRTTGQRYISLDDLQDWLIRMSDSVMSDQKQEVYKGLRTYLHRLSQSS